MPDVNLAPVGYEVVVALEGTVTVHAGEQPPIFLLAESHRNNDAIGQNLRSALNLIDAEVVRLVGVEQFTPINIKERMSQEFVVKRAGSIAAYGQSIREDNGGTDDGVIAALKARPNDQPTSFARNLILLRPDVPVVGVEDPDLRAQAQAASEAVALLFNDEPDAKEREKKRVAKFRADGVERELQRDAAFLRLALQAYQDLAPGGAILINGGGLHMQRIAAHLQAEGKAHVLIVPNGYADALA